MTQEGAASDGRVKNAEGHPSEASAGNGEGDLQDSAGSSSSSTSLWSRWGPSTKRELLWALELAGLAAFAFSRPVLDSFGRSPETFILHDATRSEIIWFGLGVALIPVLVVVAFGLLVGLPFGWLTQHRRVPHIALVAVLAGLGAWRMGQDQTGWPGTSTKLILAGLVVGGGFGFLRWWRRAGEGVAYFLQIASLAILIFVLQFLAMSPTGELAFGTAPVVNVDHADAVAAGLVDDPPSVLTVVFDALPTQSLLDGQGEIDGEMFPNFAALADDSTFYRNNTAVAGFTAMAVPAILTGQYPEPETPAPRRNDDTLFTLLAGNYNVQAKEQITRLCPEDLCGPGESAGVGQLFGDAVDWWTGGLDDPETRQFSLSGLEEDRFDEAEAFIEDLKLGANARPDFTFLHSVLPHTPWQFTDEGQEYEMAEYSQEAATGTSFGNWADTGLEVAEQRHMMMAKAADRLLGDLLAQLDEAGVYDETMVVVTADHGMSFVEHTLKRGITETNQADIAWVPLLVKEPAQTDGAVNDANVMSVDVVPTIADRLGIEIPWEVDGLPVDQAGTGRDDTKFYSPHQVDHLEPPSGEELIELDWRDHLPDVLAYRPATGSGPDGVWKLTEHGELFGRELADLAPEPEVAGELVVDSSEDFDDVATDEPLQLEVVAGTDLDQGDVVAFALNGTVAALGEVQTWELEPGWLVHGMLPPRLFEDGENELTAYLVEGEVGDEVLHPLDVSFG